MKIIGRICIILAAALVVVGVTWALAPTGDTRSQLALAQSQADSVQSSSAAADAPGIGERAAPPRRERGGGQGLFGIVDVVKNVVIIGVIAGLTLLGMRVGRKVPFFAPHD